MIHGKTKIELYNPNTKIKNIIKSENTFQSNVLADYFRHYGEEGCDPFRAGNYDGTNLWKNALGGIFLFKNPETVGNKFMSAGNTMIGNGAYGVSNSGSPNELGSYNSQESSASASEITQVYDFATNQANGNIACVCLTSKVGGYIGYGNKSGQIHSARSYMFDSQQSYRGVVNLNINKAHGNWVISISPNYSDGKLKITKTRRSLITGSAFNGYSKTIEFDLATVGDAYSLSGNTYNFPTDNIYDIGNGIFRFIPNASKKTVAPNETVYYYEYDSENDTLTQKSFTNSSNSTLCVAYQQTVQEHNWVYFLGNYAIVCTISGNDPQYHIYEVFNINTSEHLKTLNVRSYSGSGGFLFRGGSFVLNNSFFAFFGYPQLGQDTIFIYDIEGDTVYPTNSGAVLLNPNGLNQNPSLGNGILTRCAGRPTNSATGMIHNPLYLATINNLDSYITKTANQTMKVTYTLTET